MLLLVKLRKASHLNFLSRPANFCFSLQEGRLGSGRLDFKYCLNSVLRFSKNFLHSLKSQVVLRLTMELVLSASYGNNLVPSHLRLRETMLIGKNVSKYFLTSSSGMTKEANSTKVFITQRNGICKIFYRFG